MKGGSCCVFETIDPHDCPRKGIHSDKKNNHIFCDILADMFVFYVIHSLKHMDELQDENGNLQCYETERFQKFISDFLPKSIIALPTKNGYRKIGELLTDFDTIKDKEDGNYLSFCLNKKHHSGVCVYFYFSKIGESIVVITVGNCRWNKVRYNVINYTPLYNSSTSNYNFGVMANELATLGGIDIDNFIGQYKNSRKATRRSTTTESEELTPEIREIIESLKTENSQKEKENSKENSNELEDILTKSIVANRKVKEDEIREMGYKIIVHDVADMDIILDVIESESIEKYLLVFEGCTFGSSYILISKKVTSIIVINCDRFPVFGVDGGFCSVEKVFINNCSVDLTNLERLRNLKRLFLQKIKNEISLLPLQSLPQLYELIVIDSIIVYFESLRLTTLQLLYTNDLILPPLDLDFLSILTTKTNVNLELVNFNKCSILTTSTTNPSECRVTINSTVRARIVKENKVIVKKVFEMLEEKGLVKSTDKALRLNVFHFLKNVKGVLGPKLENIIFNYILTEGNFFFSETLIYSNFLNKIICDDLMLFNNLSQKTPSRSETNETMFIQIGNVMKVP